jgi:hypothetical protein
MGIGLSIELPRILTTVKCFPGDKVAEMIQAFNKDGE